MKRLSIVIFLGFVLERCAKDPVEPIAGCTVIRSINYIYSMAMDTPDPSEKMIF